MMLAVIVRGLLVTLMFVACRFHFDPLETDGIGGDGGVDGRGGSNVDSGDPAAGANLVFVTSQSFVAGNLGGLAGADAKCNASAQAAGLAGTYVAWLSTTTVDARDRLAGSRGWRRTDGLPVFDTVADIIATRMLYPIALTEFGADAIANVVTATAANGMFDGVDCGAWTDTAAVGTLTGSSYYSAGARWTEMDTLGGCGGSLQLYCFGIGANAPVAPAPVATSRRAFLSASPWTPSSGVVGADAHCQAEADASSLGGTYRALIATNGAPAIARIDTTGAPWARLDGVLLSAVASALSGGFLAPLNIDSTGSLRIAEDRSALGALTATENGQMNTTCNGWSATTGSLRASYTYAFSWTAFDAAVMNCNQPLYLSCYQQ